MKNRCRGATVTALLLVGVMVGVLAGCGGGDTGSNDAGSNDDRLPAVDLVPLAGGSTVALDQLDGPAVINLWQTYCPPCVRELPDFQSVADSRDDVTFYGINIGEDEATAAPFLADLGVTFEQFLDQRGEVSIALGVNAMPTTLVVDADGDVTTEHRGQMSVEQLNAAIDAAIEN